MSWHYLRELEGESLQDICLDGEQLPPLKLKITHAVFYCKGKLMDSYLDSLSGTMFAPLTANLGEVESMSSVGVSLVRTSLPQEKAQELMENDQECGQKWHASFVKYDPDSSLWRTHQCSLLGDLDEFLETWPQWGLMRNGECWEQQTLEQTIRGTESGLLPTPNAFPCGPSKDYNPKAKSQSGRNLQSFVAKFPTPVSSDTSHRKNKYAQGGTALSTKIGGQLNPTWVEWLMGWPLGWTDLKPLEMDKSLYARQPHGEHSQKDN